MGVLGRGGTPCQGLGVTSEGLGPTSSEQVPTWTQRRAHLPGFSVNRGFGVQGQQDLPRSPRGGGSGLGQVLVSCVLPGGGPGVHAAAQLALEPSPGFPGRSGPGGHWVVRPQAQRRARNLPEETADRGSILPGPSLTPGSPGSPVSGLKPETSSPQDPLCGANEPQQASEIGKGSSGRNGVEAGGGRLKRPRDEASGHRCWWQQGVGWLQAPCGGAGRACWEVTAASSGPVENRGFHTWVSQHLAGPRPIRP